MHYPERYLIIAKNEKDAYKKTKKLLLKICKESIKYNYPSPEMIDFCKENKIDLKKIIKNRNTKNRNIIHKCEQFRSHVFKEEYGAYSCFDLIDTFEEIKVSKKLKNKMDCDEEENVCAFSDGNNIVAWDWSSGDGTLYFKINNK